ncbi:MAG: GNAT family N-acetyltransferase, partial [Pseudomonadota bacterium]
GGGWGTKLLELAEEIALGMGCKELSIIVADNNTGARRLYERFGFREADRRAMVKGEWQSEGTEWVLMRKPIS